MIEKTTDQSVSSFLTLMEEMTLASDLGNFLRFIFKVGRGRHLLQQTQLTLLQE